MKSIFGFGFDEKRMDELFEIQLRPLKSKNARSLYRIFIDFEDVEYLTTLDLQIKLDELNINLSKKEINGWLRSLQDAGLIAKENERGKPTTIVYDDKYTFDMWRLTPKGKEIAGGINHLLRGKTLIHPSAILNLEGIITEDKDSVKVILGLVEETYAQFAILRCLKKAGGSMFKNEMKEGLVPSDDIFERMTSRNLNKGLITEIRGYKKTGILFGFLRLLGLSYQQGVSIRLTEEGQELAEKLWP